MSTRRQPRLYLVLPAILRLCEKHGTQGAAPASDPVAAAVARAFPPVLAAPPRVRRHAVRLLGRLCARLGARRHRDGALTSPYTSLHPLTGARRHRDGAQRLRRDGSPDPHSSVEEGRRRAGHLEQLLGPGDGTCSSQANSDGDGTSTSTSSSSSHVSDTGAAAAAVDFHVFAGDGGRAVIQNAADARRLHSFFGKALALRNLALERDPDIVEVAS